LDESDFGRWDVRPPFEPQPWVTDAASEERFTDSVVEVMHGRRLRQQREQDRVRVAESWGKATAEIVKGLRKEIADGLVEWQAVGAFLPGYVAGSRELQMAEHYVMWQAQKVLHLQNMLDHITS
jgi:hypothetical protein